MEVESVRVAENNEIIDHIEAVRAIVDRNALVALPASTVAWDVHLTRFREIASLLR